jgi:hypothetical protein
LKQVSQIVLGPILIHQATPVPEIERETTRSPTPSSPNLLDSLPGRQSTSIITDTNATELYSNPDLFFSSKVDLTGRIFSLPPSVGTGMKTFQMFQAGDNNRNTIVTYDSSTPTIMNEDDCVRVIGNNAGSIDFSNMFGGIVTGVVIRADSVEKV